MLLLGTNYGGFKLPEEAREYINKESVVYCVGVGEDMSFDVSLSYETGCTVNMFDPTPRAIEHAKLIKSFMDNVDENRPNDSKRFGGGDKNYLNYLAKHRVQSDNLKMYDYGLYVKDCKKKFYEPENKDHVSHSLLEKNMSKNYIVVDLKTLKTVMNELGHDHIDLLKLDIEGVECDVLLQMFEEEVFPKYVCVDFDSIRKKLIPKERIEQCMNAFKTQGYEIFDNNNLDITFVKN